MRLDAAGPRDDRCRQAPEDLAGLAGPAFLAREPDERLVILARRGDHNAFTAIVERYQAVLEAHCRGVLPPARAEDALQQTFASAYIALMRGAAPTALRPWLYAIAHNASLNALRERPLEALDLERATGKEQLPHEIVAQRESLQRVLRAVRGLPLRQREVIVRQEFHGASHEQIAAELGVTTGAVRQLAHRARRSIRAAAALIPPPLWHRIPWLSAPSAETAMTAGSSGACGFVLGKAAIAIVVAATAGGAAELSSQHAARAVASSPSASSHAAIPPASPQPGGAVALTSRGPTGVAPGTPVAGSPAAGDSADRGAPSDAAGEPRPVVPSDPAAAPGAGATPGTDAGTAQDVAADRPADTEPTARAAAVQGPDLAEPDGAGGGPGDSPSPADPPQEQDVGALPDAAVASDPTDAPDAAADPVAEPASAE